MPYARVQRYGESELQRADTGSGVSLYVGCIARLLDCVRTNPISSLRKRMSGGDLDVF